MKGALLLRTKIEDEVRRLGVLRVVAIARQLEFREDKFHEGLEIGVQSPRHSLCHATSAGRKTRACTVDEG